MLICAVINSLVNIKHPYQHLNEKTITKLVGIFILMLGLSIMSFYGKSGYKSFGLYVIPIVFIIVSVSIIFKENI